MKKSRVYLFLLMGLIFCFMLTNTVQAVRVAVLGFETTGLSWTDDSELEENILDGLANDLSKMLHEEEIADVIDSSRVKEVLSQTGYTTGETIGLEVMPHFSRTMESNLFLLGALEKLQVTEQGKLSLGPLSVSGINAEVELAARLIDANTSEIITTYSGRGESSEAGLDIDEIEGLSFGSPAFADSAVGEAIEEALDDLVGQIEEQKDVLEESFTGVSDVAEEDLIIEGSIISTIGDSLVLDIGEEDGLTEGSRGDLVRVIEIDEEETMTVSYGQVEISSVDTETSIARINETEDEPEMEDIVRFDQDSGSSGKVSAEVIEKIETPNFIIFIDNVIRVGDEVTISGTVEAKQEAVLSVYIPKGFEFFDHQGSRVGVNRSHTRVAIGNSTSSGSGTGIYTNTARVKETILEGYPQLVNWSFGRVPEEADHLARVNVYVETPEAGEVIVELEEVEITPRVK